MKAAVVGWTILLAGSALWLYGYLEPGTPSLVNWQANTPWWIANFLPNLEAEIGMMTVIVGQTLVYWPRQR